MTRKKKVILSIVLFIVFFGGLLATATFTDFQISTILTRTALADHAYLSNDAFGVTFEALGCEPVNMLFTFAFQILFWYVLRKKKLNDVLRYILALVFGVSLVVSNYILCDDVLGYMLDHLGRGDAEGTGYLIGITVVVTLVLSFLGTLAVRNFTDEQIEKLFRFAIAALVFATVSSEILSFIKGPVGRIRFRAMNMYPDSPDYGFAKFARWYEINGQWIPKETMRELFGTTDALRSFPSGHTAAAGGSYALIMLIDALEIKSKKMKAFLWIFPVVITGVVAVSRIVVGAHFFSDVLVGGTSAFVWMIISREIFICRGANVKALFGKGEK